MSGFMEYRKNKRLAKRELAKMMATTLPSMNKFCSGWSDVTDWIMQLVEGSKYITMDHVWDYAIDKLAEALETNDSRLKQMTIWFFSQSAEDMSRIISAAAMETNPDWHVVKEDDSDTEDNDDEDAEESSQITDVEENDGSDE